MNRQAGSPPPTNDVIFPTLTESIRARRCVAVIGAGVSAADYPIWAHLISQLQECCGVRAEDLPSASPLDVAQAAMDKNPAAYYQALDEIFDRRPAPRSSRSYHLLARIQFLSCPTRCLRFCTVMRGRTTTPSRRNRRTQDCHRPRTERRGAVRDLCRLPSFRRAK